MDNRQCVITGCIARKLLDNPSYEGSPKTREQLYELTVPYAKIMASKLKGRPLMTEHEGGSIGEIIHSWVTPNKQWWIKAIIDRNSRAGNDMIKAMLNEDNPFPEAGQIAELSLCHQGLKPIEVSMVVQGARDGCTIEGVELLDNAEITAIKHQQYNANLTGDSPHSNLDPPLVCASFNNMSASFTAIRKDAPAIQYARNETPDEARGILNQVEAMKAKQGQFQPNITGQSQSQDPAHERNQILRRLQELDTKNPPVNPKTTQFEGLINKLQGNGGEQSNTGNIHVMHDNPADDQHLLALASVFDSSGRNILNKQQMQEGKQSLIQIAHTQQTMKEELAKRDAALQEANEERQKLKDELSRHENDIIKQRAQTASMIAKLVKAANIRPSPSDQTALDQFQNEYSTGNIDQSMRTIQPQLIKASAFAEANFMQNDADMDTESEQSGNMMSQLQRILNNNNQAPLIKASGFNKRKVDAMYSDSSAAAAGHSSNMWDKVPFANNQMKSLFQQVEANGVDDKVALPESLGRKVPRH